MAKRSYRVYCAVFGCFKSSITHPELVFFRLPGNSERCLEWLKLICRNDLRYKPNLSAYRLCEKHFNIEDIRQSANRKLLKKNAYPILMLPSLESTVPGGYQDKQTQTDLSIGIENSIHTVNVENETYAQTSSSLSCNTRKSKLKVELLKCRKKIKLLEMENKRLRFHIHFPKKDIEMCSRVEKPIDEAKSAMASTQTQSTQVMETFIEKTLIKMEDPYPMDITQEQFMKACDKFLSPNLKSIVKAQWNLTYNS